MGDGIAYLSARRPYQIPRLQTVQHCGPRIFSALEWQRKHASAVAASGALQGNQRLFWPPNRLRSRATRYEIRVVRKLVTKHPGRCNWPCLDKRSNRRFCARVRLARHARLPSFAHYLFRDSCSIHDFQSNSEAVQASYAGELMVSNMLARRAIYVQS